MLHLSASTRYFFYTKIMDMRKGCYGLCGIVTNEMKKDILSGDVFVFINKRNNQLRLLQWEKDGFILFEKRLAKGCFERPDNVSSGSAILLTNLQLHLIIQGVLLQSVKHKKRFSFSA